MSKNILIVGASRGLGHALAVGLPILGDQVWLVSRTEPASLGLQDGVQRSWIQADLSHASAAETVAQTLKDQHLDVLIYNAGIWERTAFSNAYDFAKVSVAETQAIIAVNLTSAILCVQALIEPLQRSQNAKVILVGSISGLANTRMPEVAYNASKFGLRGAAHALREVLRPRNIAVTVVNPGSIGEEIFVPGVGGAQGIPYADLLLLLRCVLALSNQSNLKELDLPAMQDPWV